MSSATRSVEPPQAGSDLSLVAEVRDVSKRFGATQALANADLRIKPNMVHALVGRNGAGKSSLVSVLTGLLEPDTGVVELEGEVTEAFDRIKSSELACVYQRPQILDHLTVAENLFIGRWGGQWVGRRSLHRRADDVLEQWGIKVDSHRLARDLDAEQRQLVEIARSLAGAPRLVILDEPTAQLDRNASERLFERLDEMKSKGISFLFISHHLDEVFRVCQEVTIMRDGRTVASGIPSPDLTVHDLVDLMVGETGRADDSPGGRKRRRTEVVADGPPLLEVRDLTSIDGAFEGINLSVRPSEIVGLAGLGGSGKREVGEAIVGLHRRRGEVLVDGAPVKQGDAQKAIAAGVGFVPEDRHESGFASALSLADNLLTMVFGRLGPLGWIRPRKKREASDALLEDLDVRPRNRSYVTGELSGGNQQKIVIGRALAGGPKVIVGITPTAGVDVASKQFLYSRLELAAESGSAVLLVTDELDELQIADRVVVMFDGEVVREFSSGWSSAELVGAIEGVLGVRRNDSVGRSRNEGAV